MHHDQATWYMGYGHSSNTSIPYDGDINPCRNGLMTIPPFHPISGCSPSWMAIAGCEKIALSQNKVPMYHNNAAWKMLIVYLIIFPIYFPYFGVSTYFGHPWWVVSLKGGTSTLRQQWWAIPNQVVGHVPPSSYSNRMTFYTHDLVWWHSKVQNGQWWDPYSHFPTTPR